MMKCFLDKKMCPFMCPYESFLRAFSPQIEKSTYTKGHRKREEANKYSKKLKQISFSRGHE